MAEFDEIGVSGVYLMNGQSYDEYQPELQGERGRRNFREMAENDSVFGAMLTAIENLLRSAEYQTKPADDSPEAFDAAAFLDDVFEDMGSYTFDDLITEAASQFTYGFAIHEIVYKRREDGNVGLKKLGMRAQDTIDRFDLNDSNEVSGVWQDPFVGGYYYIPGEKMIHWQTTNARGNPYGKSVLRNAYRAYYHKKEIENIEAIAIERELNGLPLIRVPNSLLTAANKGDPEAKAALQKYEQIARDLRLNSQAGVVLPSDPFENTKEQDVTYSNTRKVDLELVASQGTRAIDTNPIIKRYAQDQARTTLSDWLLLGSDSRGSFALSESKTDIFTQSLKAHANRFVNTLNRQLIPKLWDMNGFNRQTMPTLVVSEVAPLDLEVLGTYIRDLSGAGVMFTDEETQAELRERAGLSNDVPTGEE